MRVGVMLAAGEASRLPNKALLPTRDRATLIIESGLMMLEAQACGRIVIVVRHRSLLPVVLRQRRYLGFEFVEQRGEGVTGAISSAATLMEGDDHALITFCDNVFTHLERVPNTFSGPLASVRPSANPQLDGWDGSAWVDRTKEPAHKLAGWYMLSREDCAYAPQGVTSVELLNALRARPHECLPSAEWHDVGTVDSYEEYMR